MAKQVGFFKITGCYDNTCFYKMDGEYYARLKSSLTGKRVKRDPAFKRTMEYAGLLGRASKIASEVYKSLPGEKKEKGFYKKLTGQVMQLLKDGKTKEDIILSLLPVKKEAVTLIHAKNKAGNKPLLFADEIIHTLFCVPLRTREMDLKPAPS